MRRSARSAFPGCRLSRFASTNDLRTRRSSPDGSLPSRTGAIALGLASCLLAAACGVDESTGSAEVRNDQTPVEPIDSVTYAAVHSLASLDPAIAYDFLNYRVTSAVCAGLLRLDSSGQITTDLAESMTATKADDGTTRYRFELRPDLVFHDGTTLTASDVKYSFERMLAPEMGSPGLPFFGPIEGLAAFRSGETAGISGISVPEDGIVEINTTVARYSFLFGLALNFGGCVVPAASAVDQADTPISAGPYRIAKRAEDRLTLERFDDYPDADKFPVKNVEILAAVDQRVATTRFSGGEVDIVGPFVPEDLAEFVDKDAGLASSRFAFDWPFLLYLTMNTSQPPLDNVELRRAINHGVDKDAIVALIGDVAEPVNQILPPQMPGHDPDYEGFEYNPELARDLVDNAVGGESVTIDFYYFDNTGNHATMAEIEKQLRAIGILLELHPIGGAELIATAGDPSIAGMTLASWSADYLDASNFFYPLLSAEANIPGTWNFAHYENPEVEELAALAESFLTEDETEVRLAAWQDAFALAMDDAPWVPLVTRPIQILANPEIHPLMSEKGMKNLLEFRQLDE